ncbi:MAG TPA: hypothetical protein VK934_08340 [Fimbriimonas sp.]|nr:hypothetical protein [Fimbriimonas sp.]
MKRNRGHTVQTHEVKAWLAVQRKTGWGGPEFTGTRRLGALIL